MKHLFVEILGVQLLHIEWGRAPGDVADEECRDNQYPMSIVFHPIAWSVVMPQGRSVTVPKIV